MSLDSCYFSAICIGGDVKDIGVLFLAHCLQRRCQHLPRRTQGAALPVCVQINGNGARRTARLELAATLHRQHRLPEWSTLKVLPAMLKLSRLSDISVRANRYGTASVGGNAVNDRDAVTTTT